jgi:hypothetical protein
LRWNVGVVRETEFKNVGVALFELKNLEFRYMITWCLEFAVQILEKAEINVHFWNKKDRIFQ